MARCLARDPKDRYPGASELKEALARALNDSGIERPEEDLASFFADCDGYRARLQARLVTRLTARAEECAAAGKEAKALDCLSRVLSLQPGNPRATALIEAMKHRRKRVKQAKSVAVVAGVLVLLGGSGVAVSSVLTHQEEEAGSNLPPLSPHDPPTFITRNTGEPVKKIDDPVLPRIEPKESDVDPHEAAKKVPWVKKKDPREVRLRDTRKADVKVAVAETATGPLTIKSRPRGDIFLDSTLMNAGTPNFDGTAPVGKHHIRIEAPCCEIYERDVEVNAGGPDPAVAAALTPRPARLKVTAPHPVKVMVGSLFLGNADQSLKEPFQIKLPDRAMSGTVALSFFQEGYKPKQLSQTFEAGALLELPMELEKQ